MKIRIEDLHFSYRRREVLNGVHLEVPSGSLCALMGACLLYTSPVIPLFNDMTLIAYSTRLTGYDAKLYGIELPLVAWAE